MKVNKLLDRGAVIKLSNTLLESRWITFNLIEFHRVFTCGRIIYDRTFSGSSQYTMILFFILTTTETEEEEKKENRKKINFQHTGS